MFVCLQAFRADRVIAAATQLVCSVLGAQFMAQAEAELALATITDSQLSATTPALLCSVPGYDASGNLQQYHTTYNINMNLIFKLLICKFAPFYHAIMLSIFVSVMLIKTM